MEVNWMMKLPFTSRRPTLSCSITQTEWLEGKDWMETREMLGVTVS